jgi:hypothetical protein
MLKYLVYIYIYINRVNDHISKSGFIDLKFRRLLHYYLLVLWWIIVHLQYHDYLDVLKNKIIHHPLFNNFLFFLLLRYLLSSVLFLLVLQWFFHISFFFCICIIFYYDLLVLKPMEVCLTFNSVGHQNLWHWFIIN